MSRKHLLVDWIGKLLIVVSLLAVPLSMSHASMIAPDNFSIENTHSMMEHDDHHAMDMSGDTSHQDHDNADCCSAICGGALIATFEHCSFVHASSSKASFLEQQLAAGELYTPHRPPSI